MLRVTVAALTLAVAASAGAASRAIHAKLTFDKVGYEYRNVELTIDRDGKRFSQRIGRTYFTPPKLHARDLDADGESEFWVDTYTGGAHCCDESRFFRFVPTRGRYVRTLHSWGNVDYRAKNIDGRDGVELVSNDDRFAYVFTSFSLSYFPIQFLHFDRGRLRDVTSLFPGQVELDANKLWRTYTEFRQERLDPRGVLAAWAADEYLLGREDKAWATLKVIRKRGELGPRPDLAGWPQGGAYLTTLRAYLRKLGYA